MPLMQGKSKEAFSKNVAAEMRAGKPQKQALGIAYSVKRKAQKKAKGGEIENEDLNPQHEASHEAENAMHSAEGRLGVKAQEHEDLVESKVDPGSIDAYRPKTMALRKEPSQAQANLSLAAQGAHFAKGGQVGEAMSRRERAIAAAMGKAGQAERMMGGPAGDGMNAPASRRTGPTGMSTPIHDRDVGRLMHPQTKLDPMAQAAFMAEGGDVSSGRYNKEEADAVKAQRRYQMIRDADGRVNTAELDAAGYYARGGTIHEKPGNIPYERPGDKPYNAPGNARTESEQVSDYLAEHEASTQGLAKGGMAHSIAQGAMRKRKGVPANYTDGGDVSSDSDSGNYGQSLKNYSGKQQDHSFNFPGMDKKPTMAQNPDDGMANGGEVDDDDDNLPLHMKDQDMPQASSMSGGSQGKKKMARGGMYAEGGPVDEMGLNDQEYDADRFLSEHMPQQGFEHVTVEEEGDVDPKMKRKQMLSGIMKELHSRHYGK